MTILESIVLGITQGITEFLPISSSGHLILVREFFGWQTKNDLAFDAVLHLATILAVGVYFRKDLFHLVTTVFGRGDRKKMTMVWAIIVGSIPAVFFGILLEDFMETVFRTHYLVGVTLVLGALLMFCAEWYAKKKKGSDLTMKKGFIIGIFQALALIPGMSRSGTTISGGLFMGLSRSEAARFSFLLGFPVLLGAGLKKCVELFGTSPADIDFVSIAFGFLFAFAVGMGAIHFLISYLQRHSLNLFIFYRIILAIIVFSVLGI